MYEVKNKLMYGSLRSISILIVRLFSNEKALRGPEFQRFLGLMIYKAGIKPFIYSADYAGRTKIEEFLKIENPPKNWRV
jgi:hypothetical protein